MNRTSGVPSVRIRATPPAPITVSAPSRTVLASNTCVIPLVGSGSAGMNIRSRIATAKLLLEHLAEPARGLGTLGLRPILELTADRFLGLHVCGLANEIAGDEHVLADGVHRSMLEPDRARDLPDAEVPHGLGSGPEHARRDPDHETVGEAGGQE
jgi:hypothetical protein